MYTHLYFLKLQGICVPPEIEHVEGEGATEFVDAEGGGFDEGQGAKNVSDEVDASNLVSTLNVFTHALLLQF